MSKSTRKRRPFRNIPFVQNLTSLGRLTVYLEGERRLVMIILIGLAVYSASQAAAPALVGLAIDKDISNNNLTGLAETMILLLAVYVVGALAYMVQTRFMGILSQRMLQRVRADIFKQLQSLSLHYYGEHPAGDLMSRLVNDTSVLSTLFSDSTISAIGGLFAVVGVIIAMFFIDYRLALVVVAVLPVMVLLTVAVTRRSHVAFQQTRLTVGKLSADLDEDITRMREAQAFVHTAIDIEHFAYDNQASRDANLHVAHITSFFAPAMDTLSTISLVLVALVGGWLAVIDVISVGVVVAFLSYSRKFYSPVQALSVVYNEMQAAVAATERIYQLLDTEPAISDKPDAIELPQIEGQVQFQDVVFSYDGANNVLNDLSLTAPPGKAMALVGETGAGKSTIVNLIGRFYDVDSGQILVDGHDVRDVTRLSLRQQMGEVPQDSFLVSDTIANNIRFGKPEASMDEVVAAAQAAHAHDFITALPDGYDTVLEGQGSSLSEGQRQLLCIARAVLPNPRLLVFDEATANVDTRTERLVQAAIDELLKNRTAFVIAHRLSTIRNADNILVIDEGRIIEQGSHEDLIAKGGAYATLISEQS